MKQGTVKKKARKLVSAWKKRRLGTRELDAKALAELRKRIEKLLLSAAK